MQGELKQVADLALFARIVQTGGISRCAEALGMERTTVSRRLGSLERNLGVKLLDRTPKNIVVTDAGRRCLEHCELLLESARHARSLATVGAGRTSSAPVMVGAPPDIIDRYIDPYLAAFETENPGMSVERCPVTTWNAQAAKAVDLGITLAPVTVPDSWTSVAGQLPQSVFCSADYAVRHDAVHTPADLEKHHAIVEADDPGRRAWRVGCNGSAKTVALNVRYVVSGLLEVREATLAGLGMARLPIYLCEPYLRDGRLVELTPGLGMTARDIVFINPQPRERKNGTSELRAFLESVFRHQVN